MARPIASTKLDPETRRRARQHAKRGASLHRRRRQQEQRIETLATERDEAWAAAVALGMSRAEVAQIAGVHHSAVDRALTDVGA